MEFERGSRGGEAVGWRTERAEPFQSKLLIIWQTRSATRFTNKNSGIKVLIPELIGNLWRGERCE